eukprot:9467945-Pyramimonas_sp.AAC.1
MQKFLDELQAKAENDEEMCGRCTCGREFLAPTPLKLQRKIATCEAAHYEATDLKMKKAKLSKGNVLFVIQSHHDQNHHCSSLLKQLSNSGVPEDHVHVRYGEAKHKITYKGLPITRGVALHSFTYRWLPKVHDLLTKFPRIKGVCYMEPNTNLEVGLQPLLKAAQQAPLRRDILWVGYRGHSFTLLGCKAIIFRVDGLCAASRAMHRKGARRQVFLDGALGGRLKNRIWRPPKSLVGMRAHMSVSEGSRRKRQAVHVSMR